MRTDGLNEEGQAVQEEEGDVDEVEDGLDGDESLGAALDTGQRDVDGTCAHTDRELGDGEWCERREKGEGRTACHDQP